MSYKKWIIVTASLFGLSIISALVAPASIYNLISGDIAALKEFSDQLASLPPALIAVYIFIKNVSSLLLSFALSPILCLMPVITLVTNGWLIATVSLAVVKQESIVFLLTGLLPHGIFELPALIMGEAAAFSFGSTAIVALFKKEKRQLLIPALKQNLKYLVIALALLVPAALVEAFITPLLLRR